MAKFLLNTHIIEEDFFADSRLVAIGSAMPGYSLCWWLNERFALDFRREPDMDVCINEGRPQAAVTGLFAQAGLPVQEQYYFPVYRHPLRYVEASLYLYGNRQGARKLIPELKHADYLLLLQCESCLEPGRELAASLSQVEGISWSAEIDIATLRSRWNLII